MKKIQNKSQLLYSCTNKIKLQLSLCWNNIKKIVSLHTQSKVKFIIDKENILNLKLKLIIFSFMQNENYMYMYMYMCKTTCIIIRYTMS